MEIRSLGEDAYFAASNSASGFFSYYGDCFDDRRIKRLYAIKGGPGTGKSRFLREVAEYGKERDWEVEYIYCSSDPDSLDGVILSRERRCIALLDATAPHVYEPSRPGVREEIINLGAFWDGEKLAARAEELEAWSLEKRSAYRRAYRYLAGAGEMEAIRNEQIAPLVNTDRLRRYAGKLMRDVEQGQGYSVRPALIHSVGMRGRVGLDTYFAKAKRIFLIEDCHGVAQFLMTALLELCADHQLSVRVSHDPVIPERLDGLFLRDAGIAFAVLPSKECAYPHRVLSVRRFLNAAQLRRVRGQILYAERMKRALMDGAIEELERVREVHFRMEQVYADAMDFAQKEAFTRIFCQRLFDLQKD